MKKGILNSKVAKRVLEALDKGDPINNEDLHVGIQVLTTVVAFFDEINFRRYDLMANDLRQDLNYLEGFATARKEEARRKRSPGGL